jgi:hypothetical protein
VLFTSNVQWADTNASIRLSRFQVPRCGWQHVKGPAPAGCGLL